MAPIIRTVAPGVRVCTPAPGIDLYQGDCRVVLAYLETVEQGPFADLVLSDPPYGIDYRTATGRKVHNDKTPPLWCIPLMEHYLKPNTVMACFTGAKVLDVWVQAMEEAGLRVKPIGWDKVYRTLADVRAKRRFGEFLLVGYKGSPPARKWIDYGQFDIMRDAVVYVDSTKEDPEWEVVVPRDKVSINGHPTRKPSRLMERALHNYSDPGGIVLDPFAGGAPVAVACIRLGRRYIGIEQDADNEGIYNLAIRNVQRELARQDAVKRLRTITVEDILQQHRSARPRPKSVVVRLG